MCYMIITAFRLSNYYANAEKSLLRKFYCYNRTKSGLKINEDDSRAYRAKFCE